MGKKMNKAPVYFAIVQIRFNAIQKMDFFAANIQDKFRKTDFPDAHTAVLNTLNLNFGGSQQELSQVPMTQLTQHTYSNFDRTACFVLDSSSLTFQTTEYDNYETFSETFLRGLNIVNTEINGIDFVERLGLRYLDAFRAGTDDKIEDYLNSHVTGLHGTPGAKIAHTFTESVYVKQDVNVTARVIIMDRQFGFPLDVQPGSLAVGERFKSISGVHSMLDIDCSILKRDKFDKALVKANLEKIHDEVDRSFNDVTTKHARKVWK
jgi:uncharacterized protein (TIGR04255 family)